MTELMRFPTEGGHFIVVEVDNDEPGFEQAGREGAIAEAKRRFEDALLDVRGAATSALRVFTDASLAPDGVEIEFGVRLNAEAGAVIAKTSVEGHLIVKLTWQSDGRRPAHGRSDEPGAAPAAMDP